MMRGNLMRGMWALAALLALTLSGCGAATSVSAQVKSSATATATPLAPLAWTPVKLPTAFTNTGENLSISPVNGHDAWMCQSTSANTYVIWKTTDAGVTWRKSSHFSYTAPMAGATCGLTADTNGTSALLATISWGCGACDTVGGAYLFSADGATHWRTISGYVQDGEFATVRGGFIALIDKTVAGPQGETQYLAFSSDGFQTWRAMAPRGAPTPFFHFAVSPDGSTLIGSGFNGTHWRSSDLGAHWTRLSSPDGQTGQITWLPQRQTFLLCGHDNLQPETQFNCSTDYGAHWSQANILSYTTPCPVPGKCGQGVTMTTQQCGLSGAESDGTLITQCLPNQTTPLPASGPSSTIVYLLPLSAITWRPVGVTQCDIRLVPTNGPVWCANATPDQLTGFATGQLPG